MTLTVAARCARTGQLGAAGLLPTPAVAHLALRARAGVGAVALQAMLSPYLADDAFDELARERDADQALRVVVANDPGRDLRQCALVDAHGRAAAWTGDATRGWAGHLTGEGVAVQGNRMSGPETVKRVRQRFEDSADQPLGERLLQSLETVDEGGDEDGSEAVSAALLVVETEGYAVCDVRVDRSARPLAELRDLYDEVAESVLPRIEKLPTRDDPLGQLARESSDGLT